MRVNFRGNLPARSRLQFSTFVRQLSIIDVHTANAAFNRARGHCRGLDLQCFRDTLLHEAFVAIPEHLVQRLFREWNASGTGELTLSEFTAGVAAAGKGSRDDLLRIIFGIISPKGDDLIVSRSDVSRYFESVATKSGCLAIEKGKPSRSWTSNDLQNVLFGKSRAGKLPLATFLAVLGSTSSFEELYFLDWITILATRVLGAQNFALLPFVTTQILSDLNFFTPRESLSSKERHDIRFELRSILFNLSVDTATQTPSSILDRFRNVLADASLVDTIVHAWKHVSPFKTLDQMTFSCVDTNREELNLFVLGLCCVQASNVDQVYRLMFELFDEDSCGQIDVEQLSAILQLTTGLCPLDSEREASIVIHRRGRSQSSLSSPLSSPGRSSTENNANPQVLSLTNFIEMAQELPGFSIAEMETAMLLFHFKRCNSQGSTNKYSTMSLAQLLASYSLEQKLGSTAFCLLSNNEWHEVIEEQLKSASTHIDAQLLYEQVIALPSDHVIMPLPIWLLISFWHEMNSNSTLHQQNYSADWTSHIHLHRINRQGALSGFWMRIVVNLTSRDGFERTAVFPQVIGFEQCTLQSVLDAALFQKNSWGYGKDASSEVAILCQVLLAERNVAGEIKTMFLQEDPTTVQQEQLATPLGLILPSLCPLWALEGIAAHDKLAFELRFSVVEVEKATEDGDSQSRNDEELVLDDDKMSQQLVYQQAPQTIAKAPRGLANLGNTCYMSAVFQCLSATPLLRAGLIPKNNSNHLSWTASRKTPLQLAKKPFPELLEDLFDQMSRSQEDATTGNTAISPMNVFKAFSVLSPEMADGNQQDAQEFLVCLLGYLSNALQRRDPKQRGGSSILSPRSHDWLTDLFQRKVNESHDQFALPFAAKDSNGRHDRLVATEWWVSHLVNDPSSINVLFSGQFKSVLVCDTCKHQSARFEPFSSLQLPLERRIADLPTARNIQDLVVILHLTDSSRKESERRSPVRVVVQISEHSTVAEVLAQLPIAPTTSNSRRYLIGNPNGFTIHNLFTTNGVDGDHFEENTPASALPKPTHAFELVTITSGGDDLAITATSTQLYLRVVHRQNFYVPFYCTTPTRQALCGSPFVCSYTLGALTGKTLYQMVFKQFLLKHSVQSSHRSIRTNLATKKQDAPSFLLCRVREDGVACSRCHWSTGCRGCHVPFTATAAELLELESYETIAINWNIQLHPQAPSAFWWLQSDPIRDHSSYIHYRHTRTHALLQSLHSLCNVERLDASCSHCHQASSPHTKQLSFWSLPPILVLQLQRFELSMVDGEHQWKKLSHNVDFPIHNLDLGHLMATIDGAHDDSELCTERCSVDSLDSRVRRGIDFLQYKLEIPLSSASRTCTNYELYAVVSHSGHGIASGHYTAQFRRTNEGDWWYADDAVVSPLAQDDLSPSSSAYLLFYMRQDIANVTDFFPGVM